MYNTDILKEVWTHWHLKQYCKMPSKYASPRRGPIIGSPKTEKPKRIDMKTEKLHLIPLKTANHENFQNHT